MSTTIIAEGETFHGTMKALIIYDDVALAAKANAMLKRASDRTKQATLWTVKPWRLDMLKPSPLSGEALAEALDTDLILFAMRPSAESLPAWLLDWLEQWAMRRQVPDAALAVFGGGNIAALSPPATSELSQFAERHGLGSVLAGEGPGEDESAVFTRDLNQRAVAQTPTLLRILERPSRDHYRDWGINE